MLRCPQALFPRLGFRKLLRVKHAFAPPRTQRLLRNFHRERSFTMKIPSTGVLGGFFTEEFFRQPNPEKIFSLRALRAKAQNPIAQFQRDRRFHRNIYGPEQDHPQRLSTSRNGLEENVFQWKTLEKRRYLDFPSDDLHDGKSLVAVTPFRGAGAWLTWKHLRQPGRRKK